MTREVNQARVRAALHELKDALGLPSDFWGLLSVPYQGGNPSTVKVEVTVKLTPASPENREPNHRGGLPCPQSQRLKSS